VIPEIAPEDRLLLPGEVAALFGVDRDTVTRWAQRGWLPSVRTPGGQHLRYWASTVRALLDARRVTAGQS
jgi:excisionase family DNA binding protein